MVASVFPRLLASAALLTWFVLPAAGQDAWLVELVDRDAKKIPRVSRLPVKKAASGRALALWSQGGSEHWQIVAAGWRVPNEGDAPAGSHVVSPTVTRSTVLTGSSTLEFGQLTMQLDQLRGAIVARDSDSSFLTPARDGRHLSGKITIRRMQQLTKDKTPHYPKGDAKLVSDTTKKTWRIAFAEGQIKQSWEKLGTLAREFPNGLPPDSYTLTMSGKSTQFEVESAYDARQILRPIREAESLLANRRDPLLMLFVLDHLLGQLDDDAVPIYLADALDFLEEKAELPEYFQKQRKVLLTWLEKPPQFRAEAVRSAQANQEGSLGIEKIDQARGLLERGNRDAAEKILKALAIPKSAPRTRGLAHLYLGVLHSEGGSATADKAEQAFQQAFDSLKAPADQLRIQNNWADYWHQRAQDHLYNHSLRMAAGIDRPLASVLSHWSQSLIHYQAAWELAVTTKSATNQSAVAVNLARHHALLSDFLRTLDVPKNYPELAAAADKEAQSWIDESLKTSQGAPLLRGMAKELQAQLAFRKGSLDQAGKLARDAQSLYLDVGFLAGVENLQRLQGLAASPPTAGLNHFRLSALISESLRQRLPSDRIGATQAGFFARKAWVLDRMVELLVQDNQAEEALRVAELARARTLQDYLLSDPRLGKYAEESTPDLSELLANWPTDTVALEYFLGPDRAYVFFVNRRGKVQAFPLQHDGKPLSSKSLIFRVQKFLQGIEGQSSKMYDRIRAGKGFDHEWQDELYDLYQQLVPLTARKEIREAKTTIIVPQHILHYFPFAALVTKKDPKTRTKKEMVTPRFWIDEPGLRLVTPSLTFWHGSRKRSAPIRQVTAIGLVQAPGADALPGVEEDLKNLKSVFGASVRQVIEGDQASVAAVKKVLRQPGMLFFGTHGHNDGERPLQSYLLLMPSGDKKTFGEQTGHLTAQAVFEAEVNADVVVMSACYSGLGDRSPLPGDDLFGMQRAFLQSGSRTVIAGLWDVYDGTAPDLMKGFFERFEKGQPVALALQDSQRDFLEKLRATGKTEPYLHPYFWSVYSLVGSERVRFEKK